MLSSFALSAQTTTSDTIGSGTTTSIHSALPGAYGYHLSAALYLGNEINHSAGDIESLSYHITYGNYPVNNDDKRVKIYLLETSNPSIDLSQTWGSLVSAATLVYDSLGCDIQWDDYWKEFVFSQPFSYGGNNLIVLVEGEACDPYPSMGDCETEIYVNNGTVNNCWNRVQDGTQISFTTALNAIPEGTHGNYYDRPNIVLSFSNGTSGDDTTNCVLDVPYTENFDNYPGDYSSIPTCWSKISQEYNSFYNSYYPVINSGSASDPNQSVMFMLMDSYSEYLILPALEDSASMQNVTMSFRYKSTQQSTVRMVVGVMTNPADTLTFVPVDTIYREGSANGWEDKEINFALYSDTGRHIAFWFSRANCSFMFPSCFIDDVNVFETPDCIPPLQISANATIDEATITWTYTNNSSAVRLYYKAATDSLFDSVEVYTDNYYTLSNLPSNTAYQYYIVTLCDDNNESDASPVYTFNTLCDVVTDFPWFDGFENGLGCWTMDALYDGEEWQLVSNGQYPTCSPFEGNSMMKYNCWNFDAGDWGSMATPALALPQEMQLSFKYYQYGPQQAFDYETMESHAAQDKIEVYLNHTPDLTGATLLATANGYSEAEGWDSVTVDIPAQDSAVYIIFKGISDFGYNLYFDHVSVHYPIEVVEEDTVLMTIDTAICEGESVEFAGSTYSAAGTYTAMSNDTLYTLNLTVNPVYNIVLSDSITEGETYTQYGFSESTAGSYTQNLTTVNGCDSIVTLNLTVLTGVRDYDRTEISITPNPARDYIKVTVEGNRERAEIALLDMSGRVVRTAVLAEGETEWRMQRGNLPNGIYMLRISGKDLSQTRKVIFR